MQVIKKVSESVREKVGKVYYVKVQFFYMYFYMENIVEVQSGV